MIPELVGRLPVISALTPLDDDALVRVLTEPKNALIKQYQQLFAMEEADLKFTDEALQAIAKKAPRTRNRRPRPAVDHRRGDARHHVRAARPAARQPLRDHRRRRPRQEAAVRAAANEECVTA